MPKFILRRYTSTSFNFFDVLVLQSIELGNNSCIVWQSSFRLGHYDIPLKIIESVKNTIVFKDSG